MWHEKFSVLVSGTAGAFLNACRANACRANACRVLSAALEMNFRASLLLMPSKCVRTVLSLIKVKINYSSGEISLALLCLSLLIQVLSGDCTQRKI